MEEMLKDIEKIIELVKKEKEKLDRIDNTVLDLANTAKEKNEEADKIEEKDSGFYKDAIKEADEAKEAHNQAWQNAKIIREKKTKVLNKAKESVIAQLKAKQKFIDDNRKVDLSQYTPEKIAELKEERDKLKEEIELNSTSKEEFEKMSDDDKNKVRKAKENYLNNKKRLEKIEPEILLVDVLGGKEPKERFTEIGKMVKEVEEKFDFKHIKKLDLRAIMAEKKQEKEPTEKVEDIKDDNKPEENSKEESEIEEPKTEEQVVDTEKEPEPEKRAPEVKPEINKNENPIRMQRSNQDNMVDNSIILIKFDAKKGCFITADENGIENGQPKEIHVSQISKENREKLKQYISKAYEIDDETMEYIDMYAVSIMAVYDRNKGTNKLDSYIKTIMTEDENLTDKARLSQKGITIDYDMRGLYRNENLDRETQRDLMNTANKNKEIEVSYVKKDLRTRIFEKIDKHILQRIERFKIARLASGEEKNSKSTAYEKAETWKQYAKPERQSELAEQVKVSDDTKQKLDEVSQQHAEEEIDKTTNRLMAGVNEIMNEDNDKDGQSR